MRVGVCVCMFVRVWVWVLVHLQMRLLYKIILTITDSESPPSPEYRASTGSPSQQQANLTSSSNTHTHTNRYLLQGCHGGLALKQILLHFDLHLISHLLQQLVRHVLLVPTGAGACENVQTPVFSDSFVERVRVCKPVFSDSFVECVRVYKPVLLDSFDVVLCKYLPLSRDRPLLALPWPDRSSALPLPTQGASPSCAHEVPVRGHTTLCRGGNGVGNGHKVPQHKQSWWLRKAESVRRDGREIEKRGPEAEKNGVSRSSGKNGAER